MARLGECLTAEAAFRMAIAEARRGLGFVSPNPLVGCTIVDRNQSLMAFGYHRHVGADHAEIDALKKITDSSKLEGATFYVTLEPCAHEGRTPSCAKALAKLPIKRVVYGLQDPNPLVAGQGAQILRDAGIEAVELGSFLEIDSGVRREIVAELEDLAEIFLHNMRTKSPFVSLKVATSIDGMMSLANGESKWITGEVARERSQHLRAAHDAVLIGRKTFEADDPKLDIRLPGFESKTNKAIVLDPSGRTLERLNGSALVSVRPSSDVIVVVDESTVIKSSAGATIVKCRRSESGDFVVSDLIQSLWEQKITSIFIEGGSRVFGSFLRAGSVQRLHLFLAPCVLGSANGIGWTQSFGVASLSKRLELKNPRLESCGPDLFLSARL